MSDTIFIEQVTIVHADWLNDVNKAVYEAIGNGVTAPTTPQEVVTNLGILLAEKSESFAATASPWTLVGTVIKITKVFVDGLNYRLNNFTIVGNLVTPTFSLVGKHLVDIYYI